MFLDKYFTLDNDTIRFSQQQASDFAKRVAQDFNPIHDVGAKRFCVPGDLLFAVVLNRHGLNQHMQFRFSGMVGEGVGLHLRSCEADKLCVVDGKDKPYLDVTFKGDLTRDPGLIDSLVQSYVKFSGRVFPDVLVPLMQQRDAMINPNRPLVVYESMAIDLDRLDIPSLELRLNDAQFHVEGKRGDVRLEFVLEQEGKQVGSGEKKMVLSGLRPFDYEHLQTLVDAYHERRTAMFGEE